MAYIAASQARQHFQSINHAVPTPETTQSQQPYRFYNLPPLTPHEHKLPHHPSIFGCRRTHTRATSTIYYPDMSHAVVCGQRPIRMHNSPRILAASCRLAVSAVRHCLAGASPCPGPCVPVSRSQCPSVPVSRSQCPCVPVPVSLCPGPCVPVSLCPGRCPVTGLVCGRPFSDCGSTSV